MQLKQQENNTTNVIPPITLDTAAELPKQASIKLYFHLVIFFANK